VGPFEGCDDPALDAERKYGVKRRGKRSDPALEVARKDGVNVAGEARIGCELGEGPAVKSPEV
jgi:hypothetical protein